MFVRCGSGERPEGKDQKIKMEYRRANRHSGEGRNLEKRRKIE